MTMMATILLGCAMNASTRKSYLLAPTGSQCTEPSTPPLGIVFRGRQMVASPHSNGKPTLFASPVFFIVQLLLDRPPVLVRIVFLNGRRDFDRVRT